MNQPNFAGELAQVRTMEQLAAIMRQLMETKAVSLRKIAAWGTDNGRPLPRATVHDVLSAVRPPQPRLLEDFLMATGLTDETQQLPWMEALERVQQTRPGPRSRSKLAYDLAGPVSAARFFVEEDELGEITKLIQQAQEEIWLWGTTLHKHIPYLESYLKEAADAGRQVKVLLIAPEGSAMTMSAFRAGPRGQPIEVQQRNLATDLERLGAGTYPGLDVRLVDYLHAYTMYAYDPGEANGTMDLRLGSFHGRHELRPTFQLRRERDGDWFDYFYEQFAAVWSVAQPPQ